MHRTFVIIAACLICAGIGFASAQDPKASPAPAPKPNSPDEPKAGKLSLARTAEFLDGVALNWTRERKCGTCHTNYAYMLARPALPNADSAAAKEIRSFFENRVAHWDDAEKAAKPRWDAEVVATAVTLAANDAASSGKLSPSARKALDRMWDLQQENGGFNWLKCDWPPFEHDDYFGAVFAAVGAGIAPEGYAKSEKAEHGLNRLRGYFLANKAPDLHHKTFLFWASLKVDGLMAASDQTETVKNLLGLQHADGGWSLPSLGTYKRRDGSPNDRNAPSDGYATGLVVYVLKQSGREGVDEAIAKGVGWLKSNQRESGRWFTRSLNNDKAHYITNAGTGFAALALKACGVSDVNVASANGGD